MVVTNRLKFGRHATAMNENKTLDVLQSFVEHFHTSINRVAQQHKNGCICSQDSKKKNK